MMTVLDAATTQHIEAELKRIHLPKGIRFNQLSFEKDWSGDDAAYALFAAPANLEPNKGLRADLRRIVQEAKAAMRALEPERLTYVYFVEGRS